MRRIEGNDAAFDLDSGRVQKLADFQAKLLRHALNEYSTAKRVVYSTCSIYSQENEAVIDDVIRNHKGKFRLVSAREKLSKWNNVGDWKHEDIGEKCIYARPESDYTSGFFVAVFERFDGVEDNKNPSADKPRNLSQNNKEKNVGLNHLNNGDMHEEEMETFEEGSEAQTFTANVVNSYNANSYIHFEVESNVNEDNSIDEKLKKYKKSKTKLSLEETLVETETLPKKDKKSKQKDVPDLIESIEPIDHQVEGSEVVPIKTKRNKRKHKESDISLSNELTTQIVASVEASTPIKIKKHKKTKDSNPLSSVQIVDTTEDITHKKTEELNTLLSLQIIDATEDILVKPKKHKKTKESKTLVVDIAEDIPVQNKKHKIIEKELETIVTESTDTILVASDNIPVKSKKHKKNQKDLDTSNVETIEVTEKNTKKDKSKKKTKIIRIITSDSSSVSLVETEPSKKSRKEKKNQSKENAETAPDSYVDSNIIDIVDSPPKKKKRKHLNNEDNFENNTQTKSKSSCGSDCLIISDDSVISEKKHKKKKNKALE